MSRAQALAIARAFLPTHPLGSRYHYYYIRSKLRTDPLYPGVLAALRGRHAPLLDLGCGLGLLAHALRADGQDLDYFGVDIDANKVQLGRAIAERSGLHDVRFEVADLSVAWPQHAGSVAILDVLQYLPDTQTQGALIAHAADMLTPGAKLVIRSGLADTSGRSLVSRVTDRLAYLAGWMQTQPRCHPTRDSLQAQLDAAGLKASFAPLSGRMPLNNWLIVAERG